MAGFELVLVDGLEDASDTLAGGLGVGARRSEMGRQDTGQSAGEPLAAWAHRWRWHAGIVEPVSVSRTNAKSIF